jgi:hypothetical protein
MFRSGIFTIKVASASAVDSIRYTRGMKLLRAAVIALLLASSSASAASGYFGVRFDAPLAWETVGQTTNTIFTPMIGVQIGIDLDSTSSGTGIRLALSSQVVSGARLAGDIYVRSSFSPELSTYLGGGGTIMIETRTRLLYLNAHLLGGLEYQVSSGIGLFAEVSPGFALGFGPNACIGAPPFDTSTCSSFVPFTLESAIGLNFRF